MDSSTKKMYKMTFAITSDREIKIKPQGHTTSNLLGWLF